MENQNRKRKVNLPDTLNVTQLTGSLLSVPALINKNISVVFLPRKALLFDLEHNLSILGIERQDDDGLFYIDDDESQATNRSANKVTIKEKVIIAKVAKLIKKHVMPNREIQEAESEPEISSDFEISQNEQIELVMSKSTNTKISSDQILVSSTWTRSLTWLNQTAN